MLEVRGTRSKRIAPADATTERGGENTCRRILHRTGIENICASATAIEYALQQR
jgi:hypothetical protein